MLDQSAFELVRDLDIAQYMLPNTLISQLLALVVLCPERADILEEVGAGAEVAKCSSTLFVLSKFPLLACQGTRAHWSNA